MTVKLVALMAVPPAVVTAMRPVVARTGTVRRSVAGVSTVKVAVTPLTLTEVAAPALIPVTVTVVPTGPLVGVNEVTVGRAVPDSVYEVTLVVVPPGVVTDTLLAVTPVGTPTMMLVAEMTVNLLANTVPNFTVVAPVKFLPVMVTVEPAATAVGV